MEFNLNQVMQLIKKDAAQNLSVLDLEYSIEGDLLTVSGTAGYTNPDCDFDILFMVWDNGDCDFGANFGKIEESLATLKIINKFNAVNTPFRAYIDETTSNLNLDYEFVDLDDISKFDHLLSQIIDILVCNIVSTEMRRLLSYVTE